MAFLNSAEISQNTTSSHSWFCAQSSRFMHKIISLIKFLNDELSTIALCNCRRSPVNIPQRQSRLHVLIWKYAHCARQSWDREWEKDEIIYVRRAAHVQNSSSIHHSFIVIHLTSLSRQSVKPMRAIAPTAISAHQRWIILPFPCWESIARHKMACIIMKDFPLRMPVRDISCPTGQTTLEERACF